MTNKPSCMSTIILTLRMYFMILGVASFVDSFLPFVNITSPTGILIYSGLFLVFLIILFFILRVPGGD